MLIIRRMFSYSTIRMMNLNCLLVKEASIVISIYRFLLIDLFLQRILMNAISWTMLKCWSMIIGSTIWQNSMIIVLMESFIWGPLQKSV